MSNQASSTDSPNIDIPNAARVYDFTLGGSHNFDADRQAAEFMFSLLPSTKKWVRMLRAFLQEAATQLWEEGLTHYIDFASGLPTEDHIHQVLPPEARVIYSDADALTVATAKDIVAASPNVLYLQNDIRQAKSLLERAETQEFLGGQKKVVFGLNGITVFLNPTEIKQLFQDLYDWAAPGSKLYITIESKDPNLTTPQWEQFAGMFAQMGSPIHLYSLEESLEMSKPWEVARQGIVPVNRFLGLPDDYITDEDREGIGIEFYAAVMEKK